MLVETTMSKLLKAYDRSRVPLYIQVASVMRQRIETKQWRPGQKISTLVELEQRIPGGARHGAPGHRYSARRGSAALPAGPRHLRGGEAVEPALVEACHQLGRAGRIDQGQRPQAHQGGQPAAVSEPEGRRRRACAEVRFPAQRPVQGRRTLRHRQSASRRANLSSAIRTRSFSVRRCRFSPA